MASNCPTEYQECEVFHRYLEMKGIPHTHIGNESQLGGRAGIIRGARLKAIGQSKGFPDYLLFPRFTPGPKRLRIAIEMKRRKGGAISAAQKWWIETLGEAGFHCAVCHGASEAIKFVESLLSAGAIDASA